MDVDDDEDTALVTLKPPSGILIVGKLTGDNIGKNWFVVVATVIAGDKTFTPSPKAKGSSGMLL